MALRSRPLLILGLASLVAGAACAVPVRVLQGDGEKKHLLVHVTARADGAGARATLTFDNHFEDPVGLEVDQLVVQNDKSVAVHALGRLQAFRSGEEARSQRVPNGPFTAPPNAKAELIVDFPRLPPGALVLVMPSLYKLGIAGQAPLKAMEVPLHVDDKASAAAARDAFFDPFVE